MALGRTAAVVIGGFPLGESDRVVTFFTRQHGKLRGVARAARRLRSRFSGALELGTLGELVFFDTGRSDLVRIDHFDVLHPFAAVRDDLERLGQVAWMAEGVGRLTAERDANRAVWGLLLRALKSVEAGVPPRRVAVVFGVRLIEALGHRLRTDACVGCGRQGRPQPGPVAVDVEAGGVLCVACAAAAPEALRVAPATVGALGHLRAQAWAEAVGSRLTRVEAELRAVLDRQLERLAGSPARSTRFVRELERFSPTVGTPR